MRAKALLLAALGAAALGGCGPAEFGEGFDEGWEEGGASLLWEADVGGVGRRQAMHQLGGTICLVNEDGVILLVDAATGEVESPARISFDGLVRVSGGCTRSKAITVDAAGAVQAHDWRNPARDWRKQLDGNLIGAPLQVANTLLAILNDGTVIAYAMFTGDELWRLELNESEFRYDGKFRPRVEEYHVVFGTPEGTLYYIDTIDGFIVWEGRLFNERDPDPTANLSLIAGPDVAAGVACAAAYNGAAGCFGSDGRLLWQKDISSAGTARIVDGHVHLVSASGTLLALATRDGRERWRTAGASSHRSPMVAARGDLVVVENGFSGLSFFEAATGRLAGGFELGGEVIDYIETGDGLLVLASDGVLSRILID